MAIQISGTTVIDNSRNIVNAVNGTFSGSVTASSFNSAAPGALGSTYQGGRVICKSGCIAWIIAPSSSEVSRTWYFREDAVELAGKCTCTLGWFVPTCGQLLNPGYACRTYWDSYASTYYWSSTENIGLAGYVRFSNGYTNVRSMTNVQCVRAFRCVTY